MCWSRGAGRRWQCVPSLAPVSRWVAVPIALKILDHPALAPSTGRGIARSDRHLAKAAGEIEHIAGLAEPGDAAAQGGHERLALAELYAEMAGAAGEIGVMEVIGLDARRH